jgi:hypothetical protein
MISIKQVISQIEGFANAHKQIKKFGFEFFEQMPNLATVDEKFPYLFVVPVGATTYENMVEFDLDVYCVDRLQKDRTNMKFTVSDTQLILTDLSVWLEDGDHDIDVERIYPQTPINNALLDYVDGWVMKIKVQVDRIELCEVPMDGIVPPDFSCDAATYEITDSDLNVLYSGSIVSGGNLDQIITDSTVVNSDATYSVSVLAEGSLVLPDITVTDSDGSTSSFPSVKNVTCTPSPDTDLEVNGVLEGSVTAGSTVDIQLSDSNGVVTPDSVTQVGNDLQIVLPDSAAPIDVDAQAFITAVGLVSDTDILAVNTFVTLAKAQGIWNDLDKVYPFIGGTASAHRYNLKNALQDGTFFGGVTHGNGVTFNGTTGYFDTAWATNAGNLYNRHLSIYTISSAGAGVWAGGSFDGTNVFGWRINTIGRNIDFVGLNNLTSIGLTSQTLSSVTCATIDSNTVGKIYNNGNLVYTNLSAINATPTTNTVFIGALNNNGVAGFYSDIRTGFVTTGVKLDATKQATLNNLVRYFNAILGR